MYTAVSVLRDVKTFIEQELLKAGYTLQASPQDGSYDQRTDRQMIPPVRISAMPHENFAFTPVNELYPAAPYILISMDKGSTSADERSLDLLIQCCVYSTENYNHPDGSESNVPDEHAEIDLLNLLEWMQQRLVEAHKIGGAVIEDPIQMGSYGSKSYTYPKAYGYLSFNVTIIPPAIDRSWADKF